jgi:iron complex outermembrane receptor protein
VKNAFVVGYDFDDWQRERAGRLRLGATSARAALRKDDVTLAGGTACRWARAAPASARTTPAAASTTARRLGAGVSHPFTPPSPPTRASAAASAWPTSTSSTSPRRRHPAAADLARRRARRALRLDRRQARCPPVPQQPGKRDRLRPERRRRLGFFGANVNFDPTRRQGLELDASQALSRTLALRLNVAFRESTFRSGPYAGNDVPLVPNRTVALRADWTPLAGHRLSGGVNWVSSQHPDFANACTMPSYVSTDARYAYQIKAVELALGVTNLFDRKYFTQALVARAGR